MTYSVKQFAERYNVSTHTVLTWIKNGDLRALNVGVSANKRKPRWRVTESQLMAFEAMRASTTATAKTTMGRKRSKPSTDVIKFY